MNFWIISFQLCIIFIVFLTQFIVDFEELKRNRNMENDYSRNDDKQVSVGIIGYTGESGKELTKQILKANLFKDVTLIGRRNINFTEDFYQKGKQVVIDFDKMDEYDDAFKQDIVYCCLGTTRGKSGVEGFKKVDYDYVVNSAKMAKKNGCKEFHLISSAGADPKSSMLYPKIKGESEVAINEMGFDRAISYRPKLLMVDREETRFGEKIFRILMKPVQFISPTLATTPVDTLAKAIIANSIFTHKSPQLTELVFNPKIFDLAAMYDKTQ